MIKYDKGNVKRNHPYDTEIGNIRRAHAGNADRSHRAALGAEKYSQEEEEPFAKETAKRQLEYHAGEALKHENKLRGTFGTHQEYRKWRNSHNVGQFDEDMNTKNRPREDAMDAGREYKPFGPLPEERTNKSQTGGNMYKSNSIDARKELKSIHSNLMAASQKFNAARKALANSDSGEAEEFLRGLGEHLNSIFGKVEILNRAWVGEKGETPWDSEDGIYDAKSQPWFTPKTQEQMTEGGVPNYTTVENMGLKAVSPEMNKAAEELAYLKGKTAAMEEMNNKGSHNQTVNLNKGSLKFDMKDEDTAKLMKGIDLDDFSSTNPDASRKASSTMIANMFREGKTFGKSLLDPSTGYQGRV